MQIQQLTYFVAVARERHFTRAADACAVAQPTLSKGIRALENSLGSSLLVRNRGQVELTSAGEALLPHAERLLLEAEAAQRVVHEVAGLRRGRLRLGATPSLCFGLLPAALAAFRRAHPGIEVEVHEAGSAFLSDDLERGRLDVALLIVPRRGPLANLESRPLLSEHLVLASPIGSDFADTMSIRDLEGVPLVMFREGYDLRETTMRACAETGFTPTLAVEGGEMDAVLRFVEAGIGVAVVPEMVMTHRPLLRATRLERPTLTRHIVVATRPEGVPLAAQAFCDQLLAGGDR